MEPRSHHRKALNSALQHRLGLLLALQCIATFGLGPLIDESPVARPVGGTIFGLMYIAGMALVADSGRLRYVLIATGLVVLGFEFWRYTDPSPQVVLAYSALLALFLIILSAALAAILASRERVTTDVIMGAVALYLNIGLIFAALYALIVHLEPAAISLPDHPTAEPHPINFLYFSLVTLTTVGYGDTVPVSQLARSLATLEASIGQLYPAIILARLVSMHVSERDRR